MIDFGDVFRILNAVLVVVYLYYMFPLKNWWEAHSREERFVLISNPVLLAVTAYANLEGVIENLHPAPRTFLFTPALILCLIGPMMIRRNIKKVNREARKGGKRRESRGEDSK